MIKDLIEKLKNNLDLKTYGEEAIKTTVILPILRELKWDIFEREEVYPEYSTSSGKVDFSLRIKSDNKVFIEAKSGKIEFNDNDEDPTTNQILRYSFDEGVPQTFMTNGINWWFYLPLKRGNWKNRRILTINIYEQETDFICDNFINYLSKANVSNGSAIKLAENILEQNQRNNIINETLPKVIYKLFSDFTDLFFLEFLAEETEKQCGYKPSLDVVKSNLKAFRLEQISQLPQKRFKTDKLSVKPITLIKGKKTWVEYCVLALKNLGGWAKLSDEIYNEVLRLRRQNNDTPKNEHWKSTIRNTLEIHSRGGGKDLFESQGIGSGFWRLKR